jgi:hypothetical protein
LLIIKLHSPRTPLGLAAVLVLVITTEAKRAIKKDETMHNSEQAKTDGYSKK